MSTAAPSAYAIKIKVDDPRAEAFAFARQKTMYGGKNIVAGDRIFVFDSENQGGKGLFARGVVTAADAIARKPGIERETPCMSISVRRTALAFRPFGRPDVKPFKNWDDGQPATEINFKLYRQATDKIVGIADKTAAFLDEFFPNNPDRQGQA